MSKEKVLLKRPQNYFEEYEITRELLNLNSLSDLFNKEFEDQPCFSYTVSGKRNTATQESVVAFKEVIEGKRLPYNVFFLPSQTELNGSLLFLKVFRNNQTGEVIFGGLSEKDIHHLRVHCLDVDEEGVIVA